MNLIISIISICLVLILIVPGYSQPNAYEKKVFTYKEVADHEIKANIFLPDVAQKHPVVVYFHGGGFIFGNRDYGLKDDLRDKLLAHNYAVVSADYRLAPETKLDEILNDVRDVILWLRQNGEKEFNVDPNKIAVAGGSAGGYLALSTGYTVQPPPQAIIAISTPTDFAGSDPKMGDRSILEQPGPYDIVSEKIVSYGDYDARMELWRFLARNQLTIYEVFGFDVTRDRPRLENFMLTKQIKSDYPYTLLLHAQNDALVPISQAELLHAFLLEQGLQSEFYRVENGHSSELIRNNPDALEKIVSFMDERFK